MGLFSFLAKGRESGGDERKPEAPPASRVCPICQSMALYLDSVDFNKACSENLGRRLPPSGVPVHYYLCAVCRFCFAPEIHAWTREQFAERIYNDGYEYVDPEYISVRPLANADNIHTLFAPHKNQIRHLDYGGGSGLLSSTLRDRGWDSRSYDPFVNADERVEDLGRYDLVTAFEVFEHVPDVAQLMDNLDTVLQPQGLLMFSTLLCDNEVALGRPLRWWYAGPRNGHISLFSHESLRRSLQRKQLALRSFSRGMHAAFRQVPPWAAHLNGDV